MIRPSSTSARIDLSTQYAAAEVGGPRYARMAEAGQTGEKVADAGPATMEPRSAAQPQ